MPSIKQSCTVKTDLLAYTKCPGYTGQTSDDLAKGHNLLYCRALVLKLRTR